MLRFPPPPSLFPTKSALRKLSALESDKRDALHEGSSSAAAARASAAEAAEAVEERRRVEKQLAQALKQLTVTKDERTELLEELKQARSHG